MLQRTKKTKSPLSIPKHASGLLASCSESRLWRSINKGFAQNKQNGEVQRLILRYRATIELEQDEAK